MFALLALAAPPLTRAQGVPHSQHVVVVVMENQSYTTSKSQPYTASLIAAGALMNNAYGVSHPSQPNYLALWSASTQSVTNDNCPSPGSPYAGENLGHACEAVGLTWRAYSENLPSVGSTICYADGNSSTGLYTRKHEPWTDFNNDTHSNERIFTDLATDLANHTLPALSFVIPNNCHNSHNGPPSCTAAAADTWLSQQLPAILAGLGPDGVLILTWDEDDNSAGNHILTVFSGPTVLPGVTSTGTTTHYRLVRTICDALGITPFANASSETPITDIWTPFTPTITWTGNAANGSWHTASNWNLNRVPAAGDSVIIPNLANTSLVTFSSGTTSIKNVSCAEAFAVQGGTLTLAAASSCSNAFTFSSGTLNGAGNVSLTGPFTWSGGDMAGTGTTTVASGVTWSLQNAPVLHRALANDGSVAQSGVAGLSLETPGVFRNRSGATFDLQSDGGISNVNYGGGSFDNQSGATLKKSAGAGTSSITTSLTNAGIMQVASGVLSLAGTGFTNAGAMIAGPGAITVTGNFTQAPSGQMVMQLAGLVRGTQYGALTVSGTATLDGTLTAAFLNGFVPTAGDSFDVLTAASRSGSFAASNLPLPISTGCVSSALLPSGVRLTALANVAFTLSPLSQSACEGASVTLTVATTGAMPMLQWRKDGVTITGATDSVLAFAAIALADSGQYDCIATNACGAVTSAAATLAVQSCVVTGPPPELHTLRFSVAPATPNPTTGGVALPFELPRRTRVHVVVYDVRGTRVATLIDADLGAGDHTARWNGRGRGGARVSAGLYCCRFTSPLGDTTARFVVVP